MFTEAPRKCRRKERQKRKGKEQPMSLWEEIADIGEEFVEFLEKETGLSSAEVCCLRLQAAVSECLSLCWALSFISLQVSEMHMACYQI